MGGLHYPIQNMRPIESQPWRIESFSLRNIPRALMPALLWDDGVAIAAVSYFGCKRIQEGTSDETVIKDYRAIGRFYTFAMLKVKFSTGKISSRELLRAYILLRLDGSVERNTWQDNLGLYWQPASWEQVHNELMTVEKYFRFVEREGIVDHNSLRQAINEILGHYVKNASAGDIVEMMESSTVDNSGFSEPNPYDSTKRRNHGRIPKMVMPEQMIDLIERGAHQPRDKMSLLLLGYCSCRTSEPLHLYVQDVEQRFAGTGATRIMLPHPATSKFHWREGNQRRYGNRRQFLWSVYGRYPRDELGVGHPEYSGWKGMTFQSNEPEEQFAVWVEEKFAGRYFQTLLEQYLKEHAGLFLSGRLQHPYLMVNTDRRKSAETYGAPLRKENARRIFYDAAARIGIEAHPHMARHHSGYYLATIAKTNLELARKVLRHAQPKSTDTYFSVHPDAARRELQFCLSPDDEPLESAVKLSRPSFPPHWR